MTTVSRRQFTTTVLGSAAASLARPASAAHRGPQAAAPARRPPDSLAGLTLAEASARIKSGSVTSTELVTACLERICIYNPKLNAFITVMRDAALWRATQLDAEQKAGKLRGPLHGIPIALKDNIDTAGVRTTAASAVFDDR